MPRAGTRSGPLSRHCGVPGKNGWPVLGLLRSPAQGKPAHYRAAAHTLIVVSGLVPRWGAKRPSLQTLRCARQKRLAGFGAAPQPGAGQACSLQGSCTHFNCGERACPALGREAALSPDTAVCQAKRLAGFGAAPQPAQGKPAHYRAAAHTLIVVSGLAPRWTRSGPLSRHCGVPGKNGWPVLGLLRSPAQGKPAHYRAAAHTLIVVSGLAPRWRAKRPSLQTLRCARQKQLGGFGAAPQPGAGQACSPKP